jgi:hypothetical protein
MTARSSCFRRGQRDPDFSNADVKFGKINVTRFDIKET